jgi:hypothetical protein
VIILGEKRPKLEMESDEANMVLAQMISGCRL